MSAHGGSRPRPTGKLVHEDLSYQVIGCAQKVHQALGPGLPESVYHRALAAELAGNQTPFENEKLVEVFYKKVLCGQFRLDMVVDEKIVVELKALAALNEEHLAQAITYLKAAGLKLALLLNFGRRSLEVKRVVL